MHMQSVLNAECELGYWDLANTRRWSDLDRQSLMFEEQIKVKLARSWDLNALGSDGAIIHVVCTALLCKNNNYLFFC